MKNCQVNLFMGLPQVNVFFLCVQSCLRLAFVKTSYLLFRAQSQTYATPARSAWVNHNISLLAFVGPQLCFSGVSSVRVSRDYL